MNSRYGLKTSVQRTNVMVAVMRVLAGLTALISFYQAGYAWLVGYDSGMPAVWAISFALNGLLWKGLTKLN